MIEMIAHKLNLFLHKIWVNSNFKYVAFASKSRDSKAVKKYHKS